MLDTNIKLTKHIAFRLVQESDANFILSLRLDIKKGKYLSTVKDNLSVQREWILQYKEREKQGREYYFIIQDANSDSIGTIRLYDFKDSSFSWGSWIIAEGAPMSAGIESVLTIYEMGFHLLKFDQCHFEVRKDNEKVISFHLRFGASSMSEDELNFYFNITKQNYLEARKKYMRFFVEKSCLPLEMAEKLCL